MGAVSQDLRYALRIVRRNPGFTTIAVLALALGIGANTAIFSVVNAVLLRPLPYHDADRLMQVCRGYRNGRGDSISIPKFIFWQKENSVFDFLSAYDFMGPGMNLSGGDQPEQVRVVHVSANYFRLFGAKPILGRGFLPAEDRPGGGRVAVLSNGLWKRRYGGDPAMVGKSVILGDEAYTVVGVIESDFQAYPPTDIWIPLQADPNSTNQAHYLLVAGRLKPGVTRAAAESQMKVVAEQFRHAFPKAMSNEESIAVVPLQENMVGDIRPALLILSGAVVFVLLIACANVANLLLARAAGRHREIAIRTAIGAGRGRLIRQLLTESILLATLGGALGLLIGAWGFRLLLAFSPPNIPRAAELSASSALDWRVLGFTLLVSLLTGILFGLVPAFQSSRTDLNESLKEGSSRSTPGLQRHRGRALLVIGEVALSLVLVIGAALLIRTFVLLRNVNPGFNPHQILTMKMSLTGSKFGTTPQIANFSRQALQRIENLPGVQAAAVVTNLPMEPGPDLPFVIPGRPEDSPNGHGDEQWRAISPDYFKVMNIPLLRGRCFTRGDSENAPGVIIINESMARRYWKEEDPVGRLIHIGKTLGPELGDAPRQIVGIVGDIRESGLDRPAPPIMYVPYAQVPTSLALLLNRVIPTSWAVRTATDPFRLSAAIQKEILAVDRQQPVAEIRSMEQVVAGTMARRSFNMLLLGIFAGTALLLAAIGIYGVMSYSVQQRTHEMGIRIALGAARADMIRLIVGQGMRLAAIGVLAGLLAAFGITRVLRSLLFGVGATDPLTFLGVSTALAVVTLLASYIPARRATKVDPIIALRYE